MKETIKSVLEEQLDKIIIYLGPGNKNHPEWVEFDNMEKKEKWDLMPSYGHCLHFINSYFPKIKENYFRKYLKYWHPTINGSFKSKVDGVLKKETDNREIGLRKVLGIEEMEDPCFVFLNDIGQVNLEFWRNGETLFDVLKRIKKGYVTGKKEPLIRYRSAHEPEPEKTEKEKAEERYTLELYKLSREVNKKLQEFEKEKAVNAFIEILKKEAFGEQEVALSPLQIDEKFNVHLPDYGTSIKLTPLEKTAYFLFLNHPEGIMFSDLPDYRNEVAEIYKHVNNRLSLRSNQKSIDKLVDPLSNSMSEKLSKVRNSFIFHHDETIVEPYIVNGERGGPKTITIERSFVNIENRAGFWQI